MRIRCALGSAALLLAFGVATAQTPTPVPTSGTVQQAVSLGQPMEVTCASAVFQDPSRCSGPSVWLSADYLLWWVKRAPNNVPLVTTGPFDPNTFVPGVTPTPGALGSPGTRVLYGNDSIDFHAFSGLRLQGGMALDNDGLFALEAGAFFLQQRTSSFATKSDAAGQPFLGRPVVGSFSGQENSIAISFPDDAAGRFGGLVGQIAIRTTSELWGAEANLALRLINDNRMTVTGLVGFRYLNLNESLQIQDRISPIDQPLFAPGFNGGNGVAVGDIVTRTDSFRTRNQLYGGQLGARVGYVMDNFDVNLLGKIALGNNAERIEIDGRSTLQSTGETLRGGVLALPSNIGVYHRNRFAVVPEIGLNLGYQVNSWMKLQVGYTFLYWNQVVRPDNVIDRTVNRTTLPTDQLFVPGAVGTRPAPRFDQTDYWAHGLNFGVEFRF